MEQKLKYVLDLQFFAEQAEQNEPTVAAGNSQEQQEPSEPKTFTQEDLNKIISERLGKEKAKWEKDYATKIEEAKSEAEKLAKMKADEKAKYQEQKRLAELEKREKEITTRELKAQALDTLIEKDLPKELLDCLNFESADTCNASLEAVAKAFETTVAARSEKIVNDKLRGGGAIKIGMTSSNETIEKQIAEAMGLKLT